MIATSSSPIFRNLASRMELIPEPETCLQRAMNEDLGCIVWKGIADYAAVKNLTDKNGHVPLQESSQIALFIGDGLVKHSLYWICQLFKPFICILHKDCYCFFRFTSEEQFLASTLTARFKLWCKWD